MAPDIDRGRDTASWGGQRGTADRHGHKECPEREASRPVKAIKPGQSSGSFVHREGSS
jgi:hypothetical protein